MLRSRSNALVSVRRVTEVNAGRKTAGVDGRIVLASWEKADLAALAPARRGRVEATACQAGVCAQEHGRRNRGLGIPTVIAYCAVAPVW